MGTIDDPCLWKTTGEIIASGYSLSVGASQLVVMNRGLNFGLSINL